MSQEKAGIPYIDPNVQFVGVSKLRTLNATTLHDLDKTLVIQDTNDQPLAVVLSYEQFLEMQKERERILDTLRLMANEEQRNAIASGLEDIAKGRTESFSEILEALDKQKDDH